MMSAIDRFMARLRWNGNRAILPRRRFRMRCDFVTAEWEWELQGKFLPHGGSKL